MGLSSSSSFGASGAGKTSILRTVAGIIDPDQGRISLGGTLFFSLVLVLGNLIVDVLYAVYDPRIQLN